MKTISKLLKIAGSAGLLVGLFVLSSTPTHAVTATDTHSAACTKIATLGDTSSATIAGNIVKMNSDFTTRLANIANRSTTIDPKVDAARTKSADAFDAKIAALQSKTGLTATQKTATSTFSTSMHTAETTRETAVDAARTAYRAALTSTVAAHQANLTAATTAYQTAVAVAFTVAGTNCSDGAATATLKTSVKSARDTYKTARSDAKVSTDIKALITTRNAAITAADATFVKDANASTTTLLAALGSPTPATNS